jgi:hypothetical protein
MATATLEENEFSNKFVPSNESIKFFITKKSETEIRQKLSDLRNEQVFPPL